MLNVTLIAVGKLKERYLTDACAEYEKRLGAYCRLRVMEVDEYRLPQNPSEAQIQAGIEAEGKEILAKIPAGSYLIPLCIEGKQISSEEFSQTLDRAAVDGKSSIVLLIGGSYGLWEELKKKGDLRMSMSRMTFPHQLARVMVLEQLYRAMTISRGQKYHK